MFFYYSLIGIALVALVIIAIGVIRYTDDKKMLTKALGLSGLTAPLVAHQDEEDWRIAYGEARHPEHGMVKFQTLAVKKDSIRLLVTDFRGRRLEEVPLIVA